MRRSRFFVPDLSCTDELQLAGDERHHAVDVLRLAVGTKVELFDEEGRSATAEIVAIDAQTVRLMLIGEVATPVQARARLHLAVAAPKQKRADWLVEKCAELGVASLRFIETERGEVIPRAQRIDRWQRKAAEAAKQSGAVPVMQMMAVESLRSVLNKQPTSPTVIFGATEVEAHPMLSWLDSRGTAADDEATCLIGPEGGWSENELTLLSERATPIRLHGNTLRIETAAIAIATLWYGFHDSRAES